METRDRFIVEFAAQLEAAQVIEAHLFAPRRVNGVESGVAVIAAALPETVVETGAEPDVESVAETDAETQVDAPTPPASVDRYTVYTATYKHTLKGPDRGKWEMALKAEADAPLVTVDQVVRGVQRRAEDTDDVERLSGEEVAAIVAANTDEPGPAPELGATE